MTSFDSRKERGSGTRSGDRYGGGHYGGGGSWKRRNMGEQHDTVRDSRRNSYDEEDSGGGGGGNDTGHKRRRVLGGGGESLGLASKATLNWKCDGEEDDFKMQSERPKGEVAYQEKSVKNRDKRMFGALMGHLGAAKKRLENDKGIFDKQKEVAKVVTMKVEKACSDAREKAQQARRLANAKDFVQRKQYTLQRQKSERASRSEKWIAYQKSLMEFLMTKASPPLTWLPTEHTDPTSAMQDERKVEIERCIAERLAEDEEFCKLADEELQVVEENFERNFCGNHDEDKNDDDHLDVVNPTAGDSTAEVHEGQEEGNGKEDAENDGDGEYKVVDDTDKEDDKVGDDDEDEVIVEASSK